MQDFRDNLANRPEPAFDPNDWEKLQTRLDQQGGNRFAAFSWWWMLCPFLLLLVGTNVCFLFELKNANAKIADWELKSESVIHNRVVYIRDTIYRTRVLQEIVYVQAKVGNQVDVDQEETFPKEDFSALASKSNEKTTLFKTVHSFQPETLPFSSTPLPKDSSLITQSNESPKDNPHLSLNKIPYAKAEDQMVSPLRPNPLPEITIEAPLIRPIKTLRQQLYALRPKGYQLGSSGAWATPLDSKFDKKSGYSLGFKAAIDFSSQLSLWADASFLNIQQVSYRMGQDLGIPVVSPPSDAYTFSKAEVPQSYLQYSLGVQYLFHSKTKVKPMFGLGYGFVKALPKDIIYEFNDQTTGVQWDYGYEVPGSQGLIDFVSLSAGLQYPLSRKWNFVLNANYRTNLGRRGGQAPKLFGIQSGMNLRLGK